MANPFRSGTSPGLPLPQGRQAVPRSTDGRAGGAQVHREQRPPRQTKGSGLRCADAQTEYGHERHAADHPGGNDPRFALSQRRSESGKRGGQHQFAQRELPIRSRKRTRATCRRGLRPCDGPVLQRHFDLGTGGPIGRLGLRQRVAVDVGGIPFRWVVCSGVHRLFLIAPNYGGIPFYRAATPTMIALPQQRRSIHGMRVRRASPSREHNERASPW